MNYEQYLKIPQLLALQQPLTTPLQDDETLFIVVHQIHELWFKQLIFELQRLPQLFSEAAVFKAIPVLQRINAIIETLIAQIKVLETMTPLEFLAFRERLDKASGFQSRQFRVIEDLLQGNAKNNITSLWQHFEGLLKQMDYGEGQQHSLLQIYQQNAQLRLLCEQLVDIDENLQLWRVKHYLMVQRTIGDKRGTGGSGGAQYLATTLFKPLFPLLWQLRSQL